MRHVGASFRERASAHSVVPAAELGSASAAEAAATEAGVENVDGSDATPAAPTAAVFLLLPVVVLKIVFCLRSLVTLPMPRARLLVLARGVSRRGMRAAA